jgi:hypothetical protein
MASSTLTIRANELDDVCRQGHLRTGVILHGALRAFATVLAAMLRLFDEALAG